MVAEIANIIAAGFGFAAIFGLVWLAKQGTPERDEEDAARAFFDRHGHWPDEPAPP